MTGDTIYALSSGPPPAAIAVIRISGPQAGAALQAVAGRVPAPRQAAFARLRDPQTGDVIDEALALFFPGPKSETGEDVAEIQLHGGRAVIAALFAALASVPGLRPAEPGEFTRRAFANGKLDLTKVEGLADLIFADTEAQRRQALRQLQGLLGDRAEDWRRRIIAAQALAEAGIDFSDEGDVAAGVTAQARAAAAELLAEISAALADSARGERLREGLVVAIAGPPNAGKSTLLNRLARREAAIVSPFAGTTRDVIEVQLDLDGIPVVLLDTAGLRETDDPVEAVGVERARRRAAEADLLVHVLDAFAPARLPPDERAVVVRNKVDLLPEGSGYGRAIGVSCLTGAGLAELVAELGRRAVALVTAGANPVLTRARHRAAVAEALTALDRFGAEAERGAELALLTEDLRLAAGAIGGIVGAVGVEDVLDRIFASFCIGK